MLSETDSLDSVVEAARAGGPNAWAELIARFHDVAAATALGWSGDVEAARDAAQEAFALAFAHVRHLDDVRVFPAWFLHLVRTACSRQYRRRAVVALAPRHLPAGDTADPARIAVERRDVWFERYVTA